MSSPTSIRCPACATEGSGRYCPNCGAALLGATCSTCATILTPGARFCHHCGAAAVTTAQPDSTQPAPASATNLVPWAILGVAAVALVVLVAVQRDGESGAAAPAAALEFTPQPATRAPDISSLTPRERADRLYDRVMRLDAEGKGDSATFFAQMALGAYESLGSFDSDLRYDYGRMAEIGGELDLARQQAAAILAADPAHLLGLVLSMRIAEKSGANAEFERVRSLLRARKASEYARNLPEYVRHRAEIEAAAGPDTSR
ncbi:MAG: zinc ribbon domain-containing protein [Gemmatimonadota bacterium]